MNSLATLKGGIPETHRWAHRNSIASFRGLDPTSRYYEVIGAYRKENRPLTDREVAKLLGYSDMNKVRPRIAELIDFKILQEAGQTKDSESHKTVRVVKLVPEKQLEFGQ